MSEYRKLLLTCLKTVFIVPAKKEVLEGFDLRDAEEFLKRSPMAIPGFMENLRGEEDHEETIQRLSEKYIPR